MNIHFIHAGPAKEPEFLSIYLSYLGSFFERFSLMSVAVCIAQPSQPFEIQDLQVHWMKHSELHIYHPTTSHVTLFNTCHVLLAKASQSSTYLIRSSISNPPQIIHITHVHVLLTKIIYFPHDIHRRCVCCVVRGLPPRSLTLRPSKEPSCSEFLKAHLHSQQPAANPRFHRIATTTTTYLTLTCLASSHILTQLLWHLRQGHFVLVCTV